MPAFVEVDNRKYEALEYSLKSRVGDGKKILVRLELAPADPIENINLFLGQVLRVKYSPQSDRWDQFYIEKVLSQDRFADVLGVGFLAAVEDVPNCRQANDVSFSAFADQIVTELGATSIGNISDPAGLTDHPFILQFEVADQDFLTALAVSGGFTVYDTPDLQVALTDESTGTEITLPQNDLAGSSRWFSKMQKRTSFEAAFADHDEGPIETQVDIGGDPGPLFNAAQPVKIGRPFAAEATLHNEIFEAFSKCVKGPTDGVTLFSPSADILVGDLVIDENGAEFVAVSVVREVDADGQGKYEVECFAHDQFGHSLILRPAMTHTPTTLVGVVSANGDPQKLGDIHVSFPWNPTGEPVSARWTSWGGGNGFNSVWLPPDGTSVLLVAEGPMPITKLCALATVFGQNNPLPLQDPNDRLEVVLAKTKAGGVVRLSDHEGNEEIELGYPDDQLSASINKAKGIKLSAGPETSISISNDGIVIETPNQVTIKAPKVVVE